MMHRAQSGTAYKRGGVATVTMHSHPKLIRGYWAGWHTFIAGKPFEADIEHRLAGVSQIGYEDGRLAAAHARQTGTLAPWALPKGNEGPPQAFIAAVRAATSAGTLFSKGRMEAQRAQAQAAEVLADLFAGAAA